MKRNRFLLPMLLLLVHGQTLMAQEKGLVIQGNQLYGQQKYKEAQEAYQQALKKNPNYTPGLFNLGNALIQQKKYDSARKVMAAPAKTAANRQDQSGANYNIGNTYMSEQKWSDAVEAYKQALRKNPMDADAKYNLSYALEKMKQEQKNNKDKKNKDKNKDNKQDKKDQKDKKDGQDKKDQDNKNGQDKKDQDKNGDQQKRDPKSGDDKQDQQQGKRPEPQPSTLSQQQADNILKALEQEERKLQDKKQTGKGVPAKMDKDW